MLDVTLRLITPSHYRKFVTGVEKLDDPSSVISEWAQLTGESVAAFTGGITGKSLGIRRANF